MSLVNTVTITIKEYDELRVDKMRFEKYGNFLVDVERLIRARDQDTRRFAEQKVFSYLNQNCVIKLMEKANE